MDGEESTHIREIVARERKVRVRKRAQALEAKREPNLLNQDKFLCIYIYTHTKRERERA